MKKLKILLCVIILIAAIFSFSACKDQPIEENNPPNNQTNNETKYVNGIDIYKYSTEVNKLIIAAPIQSGQLPANSFFQDKCLYKIGDGNVICEISGDDSITSIIPREYFYNFGEQIHFTENYGYYISTVMENSYFKSTVAFFDLVSEVNFLENITTSIKILFKVDYFFFTKENLKIKILDEYENQQYMDIIFNEQIDDAIIPAINCKMLTLNDKKANFISYKESKYLQIEDIAVSSRVNCVELINDEIKIVESNETEFFLNSNTVQCQATVNGYKTKEVGTEAVNIGLGTAPFSGTAIIDKNNDIFVDSASLKIMADVSFESQIYFPSYNFLNGKKEDQIAKYNEEITCITNIVNGCFENRLFFNSGNFLITNTNFTFINKNRPLTFGKVCVDIGLKINGKVFFPVTIEKFIYEPEPNFVEESEIIEFEISPNNYRYYNFIPKRSGQFFIKINGNGNFDIFLNGDKLICAINNVEVGFKFYDIDLHSGQEYTLKLENRTDTIKSGNIEIIYADIFNKEIELKPEQIVIIKAPHITNEPNHKIYTTSNNKIEIMGTYDTFFNYNFFDKASFEDIENSENINYYIVKNADKYNNQTLKFTKKDDIIIDNQQASILLNIPSDEIYQRFSFTAPEKMTYYFSLNFKENKVFNSPKILDYIDSIKSTQIIFRNDKKYYKISLNKGEKIVFSIEKTHEAINRDCSFEFSYITRAPYIWLIDGEELTDIKLIVERGRTVEIALKYENTITQFDGSFINDTSEKFNVYGIGNKLFIPNDCFIGHIELKFRSAAHKVEFEGYSFYEIPILPVNIIFEKEINNSLLLYNDGTDFGIYVNDINIINLKFTLTHNFKIYYFNKLVPPNGKISLKDLIKWTSNFPKFEIKIYGIWYNFSNQLVSKINYNDNGLKIPLISSYQI